MENKTFQLLQDPVVKEALSIQGKLGVNNRKVLKWVDGELSDSEYQTVLAERKQLKARLAELETIAKNRQ